MFKHKGERSIEDICYNQNHIEQVVKVLKKNFKYYFDDFINLEAGYSVSNKTVKKIENSIGISDINNKKNINVKKKFKNIITDSINDFEKDREKYKLILDRDSL
jgi:hypothetical protein